MNRILRKLLGVLAIGLSWGPVWCAFFVTLVLIIGIIRPQDIDPGEGPGIAGKILLTTVDNRMIYILCPLGAACASASVAIARKMDLHAPERSQFLRWIGFILAKPLQAVCASK